MSISSGIRCPECHSLMEEGFIPTGGGLHWFRKPDAGPQDFAEAIPGTHAWLRRARLAAWRCRKCHLITFRYGRAIDPDTGQEIPSELTPSPQSGPSVP